MKKLILSIPIPALIILSIFLGLAPFNPEPHLVEKFRLLFSGNLSKWIDIFDLLMHACPIILLAIRLNLKNNA